MTNVSVIICSKTPAKAERATKMYEAMGCEVIVMFDQPSMAVGYNAGLKKATGETICFSHDDVDLVDSNQWDLEMWGHREAIGNVSGVAGTSRLVGPAWSLAGPNFTHGRVAHLWADGGYGVAIYGNHTCYRESPTIQAMDGLFLVCGREVAEAVPWDEDYGWHLADISWTYSAFKSGFRLTISNDLPVIHASGGDYGSEAWKRDAAKFMAKWGDKLEKPLNRPFQFACVEARDRDEAVAILRGE